MYSLLSAAVLACDVARHPHGAQLADTVDRLLALTPCEAAAIGPPAPEQVRRRALEVAADPPRVALALREAVAAGRGLSAATLEGSLVGTLVDLHALVRREVALTGPALQVALDAVTVAWQGPRVPLLDREELTAPWVGALDPVPPALPHAPYAATLTGLLEEVLRRRPEQWRRSVTAHRARGGALRWSDAAHQACAAAVDAGRLREVARAQLAAARGLCLVHTGCSPYGVGMVVTGAVQAVCTADLVTGEVTATLCAAWEAGC